MNHYVGWLHDVAKLVYLVGNYERTATIKKLLEPTDQKNRIYFRCVDDFPEKGLQKIKLEGAREGILRADWLAKILERYPEMVIFVFSCGEETEQQKIDNYLRDILKKINLFMIDVLKANNKDEVCVRFIVTLTKAQASNPIIVERVNYFLKAYEKDTFVIPIDNLARDVAKYRHTWLNFLDKNYEKKLRKLQRKFDESVSLDKRISYSFKVAIFSEILTKDERQRYNELVNILRFKFSQITKKELSLVKYLEIREIRIIADIAVLRIIRQRNTQNPKEIPAFIQDHINFFKIRSLDPKACHFYYYYQELIWRSSFLQQVLEVLGAIDILDSIPHFVIAEWLNGLLSYLHRLATASEQLLSGLQGEVVSLSKDNYLGRYDYGDVTDADVMKTQINQLLRLRKDCTSKGIQLITRYKCSGLFQANQMNFLNIYLIRFYLAQGKFAAIANIYNQILKVEVNRYNFFLINQLFRQIQGEIVKVDSYSRKFIYGVLSLICDYFENKPELNKYLQLFFNQPGQQGQDLLKHQQITQPQKDQSAKDSLFAAELSPEAHIFKLKKNSHIVACRVLSQQQIIRGNQPYKLILKLNLGKLVRQRLQKGKNLVVVKFNHHNMVAEVDLQLGEDEGEWVERELVIQPLYYMARDAVFHIQEVQLVMENRSLVWLLQKEQLVYQKYDSTMFHNNITEPKIEILNVRKVYYLNETFSFEICVKGIEGCKVSAKLSVEEPDGKTQFFMGKDDKNDLTNSNRFQELAVGDEQRTTCWVKCNKLGMKVVKLLFNIVVEKYFDVSWKDKPYHIKTSYSNVSRELRFNVLSLFSITKTCRQAITGATVNANIPLGKKILMNFNLKANDHILITEITHHNNPRKIKYHKIFKASNLELAPAETVKLNMIFELGEDCADELELFLTTLLIKWRRQGSVIDNVTLDQNTMIHPTRGLLSVSFHQKQQIVSRKKGSIFVKVENLRNEPNNVYVSMDSTEQLMRIGIKGKWQLLQGFGSCQIEFNVMCMQAGIFELPPVHVFLNNTEVPVSTDNFLVHCL